MNRRGFTLVELLGIIVILSIIMLIAIPNITSVLERSKKDSYIADCKKMISLAQYELRKGVFSKPTTSSSKVTITLNDLATDDIVRDTDGYTYDLNKSYVKISNDNGFLIYSVQLVASNGKGDNSYRGIKEAKEEDLTGDSRYQLYRNNINLGVSD